METWIKKRLFFIGVLAFPFCLVALDFSSPRIPLEEIKPGGPPKDGIPALLKPTFLRAAKADYLRPTDRVVGVVLNGKAKAYPIRLLNWHEIVNDTVGSKAIVVTYCPLCGTAMVFESQIGGQSHTFGVSGLLYNSDVLMYDHQTESLWSQLKMQAVTGPKSGTPLTLLPSRVTTWDDWRTTYSNSLVLSKETGHSRNYDRDPYEGYDQTKDLYFPVKNQDQSRHPKDWVHGVIIKGAAKAYPHSELSRSQGTISDTLRGESLQIQFDKKNRSVQIFNASGQPVPGVDAFWFAWKAFYPKTAVYQHP